MGPYRTPAEKPKDEERRGPRWGATRWVKFWTKHRWLERVVLWTIIVFIVIPVRIILSLFGQLDGGVFDF